MGYDGRYWLSILTPVDKEKEFEIDKYITDYFNKTGNWMCGKLKYNPIFGEDAGKMFCWGCPQNDMEEISNHFKNIKFLLYCHGEDEARWFHIFKNGKEKKVPDIQQTCTFTDKNGNSVTCETDDDVLLDKLVESFK